MDRRKILAAIYAYQGLLAMALGIGVVANSVAEGQIIAFMLLVGFSWTVNEPAVASIIANTVPRKGLLNAFALSNMGRASTRLAIPAVGGLMIELWGGGPTLFAEAFLFFVASAVALTIRIRVSQEVRPRPSEAITGLIEGAKYVKSHRNVLALLCLQFSAPLFMYPFIAGLLPVYAAEVYGVEAGGLGLLLATGGLGMLVGAFLLATLGDVRRKGAMILMATGVAVLAMTAVSLLPWFIAGLVLLTVVNGVSGILLHRHEWDDTVDHSGQHARPDRRAFYGNVGRLSDHGHCGRRSRGVVRSPGVDIHRRVHASRLYARTGQDLSFAVEAVVAIHEKGGPERRIRVTSLAD